MAEERERAPSQTNASRFSQAPFDKHAVADPHELLPLWSRINVSRQKGFEGPVSLLETTPFSDVEVSKKFVIGNVAPTDLTTKDFVKFVRDYQGNENFSRCPNPKSYFLKRQEGIPWVPGMVPGDHGEPPLGYPTICTSEKMRDNMLDYRCLRWYSDSGARFLLPQDGQVGAMNAVDMVWRAAQNTHPDVPYHQPDDADPNLRQAEEDGVSTRPPGTDEPQARRCVPYEDTDDAQIIPMPQLPATHIIAEDRDMNIIRDEGKLGSSDVLLGYAEAAIMGVYLTRTRSFIEKLDHQKSVLVNGTQWLQPSTDSSSTIYSRTNLPP